MFAVNHMEQKKLSDEISVYMRIRKSRKVDKQLTINHLSSIDSNPELRANSCMFMKTIRGTVAYWVNVLQNLLSTVNLLGPPTLFVTVSADDNHWPELKMLLFGCSYHEAVSSGRKFGQAYIYGCNAKRPIINFNTF